MEVDLESGYNPTLQSISMLLLDFQYQYFLKSDLGVAWIFFSRAVLG